MTNEKVLKTNQKMRYEIRSCELLESYMVETHRRKLEELNGILSQ